MKIEYRYFCAECGQGIGDGDFDVCLNCESSPLLKMEVPFCDLPIYDKELENDNR
jgi:hypothetical protein